MQRHQGIKGMLAVVAALTLLAAPVRSQGVLGRIKQRAHDEANRKEDEALDKAVKAVACAITDSACIKKAHDAGKPVKVDDKNGKPVPSADSAAAVKSAVDSTPPPSHAPATGGGGVAGGGVADFDGRRAAEQQTSRDG